MSVDFMAGYIFGWLVFRHIEPWAKRRWKAARIDGDGRDT